ncbi:hypothetical protein Igag_1643 [Ignisphaera aggregans DSM 17230]|uniref:Uncharacterized protein n=1 Tax=Ignisphaera aggregans (strain DSM 17230 / JCM 13409 / AQ1.S1) TaxID=583356 RepID=E0SRR0_IGNAA|nr:hypothetical protein Igag_1643 [Ignisphaera aggregans DSM 17230]
MVDRKRFTYLLLTSLTVMISTTAMLFLFIGTPRFFVEYMSILVNDPIALILIFVVSIIVTSIGGILTFSSDNEYLMAVGVIMMLIGILMVVTSLPRLVDMAYRSLGKGFEEFMKRITNTS